MLKNFPRCLLRTWSSKWGSLQPSLSNTRISSSFACVVSIALGRSRQMTTQHSPSRNKALADYKSLRPHNGDYTGKRRRNSDITEACLQHGMLVGGGFSVRIFVRNI